MRAFLLSCHDNWMLQTPVPDQTCLLCSGEVDKPKVRLYEISNVWSTSSEVGDLTVELLSKLPFTMTRSGAFKLSILFFITFILCLPEFFPNLPCAEAWYLCKTETDLQLLTLQSDEYLMVVLAMKGGNLSGWNISEFAVLNNTDLYTGPQNDQRLFHCYLPPDNSNCPDLNISMQENTSPPTQDTTFANPTASSLTTSIQSYRATASTDEFKCQPTTSSFLFYYQEHNKTARSAALPVQQTRRDGRWCVITSIWLALVLTVVVVTLLSVGNLIFRSRKGRSNLVASVPVLACGHQLKELGKQKENLTSKVPDVSIAMCKISGKQNLEVL
ncbi:Alcohol dehydrogenase 3, mitochondrial [Labeo rohita]|uniref:Alcohol dehydrogenase 3, mitochondrial n=1 Tax=Labeo rohita TaxID=84645 RepID=A0ABQ8N0M0_LABRO|nr:Alcohol dehydrogenase 3, mitochondrial [Labeo rohita]